jgi:hypothetical protein
MTLVDTIQHYRPLPTIIEAVRWNAEDRADANAEWCDGDYDRTMAGGNGHIGEDWGRV